MVLQVGHIVERRYERSRYRIVDFCTDRQPIDLPAKFVVAIRLDAPRLCIQFWSYAGTLAELSEGRAVITEETPTVFNVEALSSAEKARWAHRRTIARRFEDIGPMLYYPEHRSTLISNLNTEGLGSRPTLYRLLADYLKSGKAYESLAPNYHLRGGPGKDRATAGSGAKLGRPRTTEPGKGIVLTEENIRNMRIVFQKRPNLCQRKIRRAWYHYLITYHHDDVMVVPKPPGYWSNPDAEPEDDYWDTPDVEVQNFDRVPSLDQFRYQYNKEVSLVSRTKRRLGRILFEQKHSTIATGTAAEVDAAGTRFYIDSTTIDVYVVSRLDRNVVIGRPTLYVVVDQLTRLIVGIHIGLEPPNWIGGVLAIYNCCVDKVSYCARHQIKIEAWQWPTAGLPIHLMGDRGDLFAKDTEALASIIKIVPDTAPPYRGDAKSVVERTFGVLQMEFGPFLPGYVDREAHKSITPAQLRAALTLEELTRVIIDNVLLANRRDVSGYMKSARQLQASVPAEPLAMWHWCAKELRVVTRKRSLEDLASRIWPRIRLKTTRKALQFGSGLHFQGETLERQIWYQEAKLKRLDLFYGAFHPSDLSQIVVLSDHLRDTALAASMTPASRKQFEGLTISEVAAVGKKSRQIDALGRWRALPDVAARHADADATVAAGRRATKAAIDPMISKSEKTRDIKKNRDREIDANHAQAAGVRTPPSSTRRRPMPNAERASYDEIARAFDNLP